MLASEFMYPPAGINADNIDIKLIVLLLGAISTISVFLGLKTSSNEEIMIAVPFSNPSKYQSFRKFNENGYIFDFTNYIYLLFIIYISSSYIIV